MCRWLESWSTVVVMALAVVRAGPTRAVLVLTWAWCAQKKGHTFEVSGLQHYCLDTYLPVLENGAQHTGGVFY